MKPPIRAGRKKAGGDSRPKLPLVGVGSGRCSCGFLCAGCAEGVIGREPVSRDWVQIRPQLVRRHTPVGGAGDGKYAIRWNAVRQKPLANRFSAHIKSACNRGV